METENIRLKTLLAAVLSVVFLEILGANIVHVWHVPAIALLGSIRLLDIALLMLIVIRNEKSTLPIGFDPARIPAGIRRGVLWSLAFGLVAALFAMVLYGFDINLFHLIKAPLPKSITERFLYFFVGGIVGPATEEVFFRGVIFLFFRRWGFLPAFILSTASFVLLHPLSSGIPLPQIVGGILFVSAMEIEKNLLVPTIIHISGNLAIFTVSLLGF